MALLVAGCGTLAVAPARATAADTAPPLIAGRVAAADGEVRIWRAEEAGGGQWDRAQLNDVVTAGIALAVDNGRAEVRIGPHALRLGTGSSGGFSQLDFSAKTFNLERGVVNLRLAPAQQGEAIAMLVGGVRVDLAAPGRYRIDAVDSSPLNVTVFEGAASVRYGSNSLAVAAGQALLLTQSSINFAGAQGTALDDWGWARDAQIQATQAARFVSPYMTGYEELDTHGEWVVESGFGTVWVPRAVPAGWAPYRDGRWRWVAPWGWTWVDAAPWGYAPFHYGRWVVVGGRWCWWPGAFVAQPVWAPALVGFVGTSSVTVGFGGPVVGWYPLAPWQPFRPTYVVNNTTYVTVINQTIIQRPPAAVPFDVNQRPGSTWVPGTSFREPVAKVRLPARTAPVADAQPIAPPPRPLRGAPVDNMRAVVPGVPRAPGSVPDVIRPPKLVLAPSPPLPGADTSLAQPAPMRAAPVRPLPPAPGQLPDNAPPRPKVPLPQSIVPPYQQLQNPNPAQPARVPPAAPPTIRQPPVAVPPPRIAPPAAAPVAAAPAARAVPPAPAPHSAATPKLTPATDAAAHSGDARQPRTPQQER